MSFFTQLNSKVQRLISIRFSDDGQKWTHLNESSSLREIKYRSIFLKVKGGKLQWHQRCYLEKLNLAEAQWKKFFRALESDKSKTQRTFLSVDSGQRTRSSTSQNARGINRSVSTRKTMAKHDRRCKQSTKKTEYENAKNPSQRAGMQVE